MPRIQLPVYPTQLADGSVASGAKLHFLVNRSNPPLYKNVYLAADFEDAAPNPYSLDDSGYTPDLYGSGAYTIVCRDQDGGLLWSRDDVVISETQGQFSDWSPIDIYQQNAIVRAEDGLYYVSLTNNNINQNPYTTPAAWSKIVILKLWNELETYAAGETVLHLGSIWLSAVADNLGNEPETGSSEWTATFTGMVNPMTTTGDLIVGAAAGSAIRLGIGTSTQVLTVVGGAPAWADAPEGGGGGGGDGDLNSRAEFEVVDLGNVATSGSQTINIDLSLGNVFLFSMQTANTTGTLTFTVSNVPASGNFSIQIIGVRPGRKTIAWPAGWVTQLGVTMPLSGTSNHYAIMNVKRLSFWTAGAAVITLQEQQEAP